MVIELSPDDPAAALRSMGAGRGPGGPGRPGAPTDGPGRQGDPRGPMGGPPPGGMTQTYKPAVASVTQMSVVFTTDGKSYAPSHAVMTTDRVKNLIVDDFQQFEYHDPKTGDTLKYNLFTPKGYDKSKSYPLVLFMPDASATSPDPSPRFGKDSARSSGPVLPNRPSIRRWCACSAVRHANR